ncbi:MAG: response regulator [Candidatus Omnitrophota bacterium]
MEKKNARILVVDDESEIVDALKHFLSRKGYEVIGVFSGREALKILEREKIGLILLDIMLPDLKGTEVARIIKDKYPFLKIFIISGCADEDEKLYCNREFAGFFTKPVEMRDLYIKLSEALDSKEKQAVRSKNTNAVKVRLFLIRAKLLFVEPCLGIYNSLSSHLKQLDTKGEVYAIEQAVNKETLLEKISSFNPELLVVNTSFFEQTGLNSISKITKKELPVIVYDINETPDNLNSNEMESNRLAQMIKLACLKNGFIEIKWVEI